MGDQGVMDEALALTGRVAVVTGAGHGLGRAEALALARAGLIEGIMAEAGSCLDRLDAARKA